MFTKNQLVIKVIRGPQTSTATLERVVDTDRHCVYLGDASESEDVNAFDVRSGFAKVSYIPGFSSYLVALDGGEEQRMLEILLGQELVQD